MSQHPDATLDDARSALDWIPNLSSDREIWLRVGMALRGEFGDGAFEVWDRWSSGYAKYSASECSKKWRSFKGSSARGSVSIGYIFKLALDANWKFDRRELTAEQKKAFAIEQAERRKAIEIQRKKEDEEIAAWYEVVAKISERIWSMLHTVGRSPYLGKKKVGAHGVRFAHEGIIIHTLEDCQVVRLVINEADRKEFFKSKTEETKFFYLRPGDLVVPLRTSSGRLMNLQIISVNGKKMFMRNGRKSGLYHFIGESPTPGGPIAIAEGYATAATAHEARGWPVAVAIDAGNLPVVAETLFSIFPESLFFILADDDRDTEKDNLRRLGRDENERDMSLNPGIAKANEAAKLCRGCVVVPIFDHIGRVIADV